MKELEDFLRHMESELVSFPPYVREEVQQAATPVSKVLTPEQMYVWLSDGLAMARNASRSWEAAAEYFRVSPQVLQILAFEEFRLWAQWGSELAQHSSGLGAPYFRASPASLPHLTLPEVKRWAELGWELYRGTWRSAALSTRLFEMSPELLGSVTIGELEQLVRLIDSLSQHSYPLASASLEMAPNALSLLQPEDRAAFLAFAQTIVNTSWSDARLYMDRGPAILEMIEPRQRARYLRLAQAVVSRVGRQAYNLFADSARAMGQVPSDAHNALITMAEDLVTFSGEAPMDFLKSGPRLLERIRLEDLPRWHQSGVELLSTNQEGGEAYFRLESMRAEEVLDSLSSRVELARIGEILRMYCKALTGFDVSLQPAANLAEKGIGWVSLERPSTEGTAIYLPEMVEESHDKSHNFNVYKVFATHQTGHLEFGSFSFVFDRPGNIFPMRRVALENERGRTGTPVTDMERFFDLFDDRQLASDIFTIVEDARIDFLVGYEYGGIRRVYRSRQQEELSRRPAIESMPLRQGFLENLIRASLLAPESLRWPAPLMPLLRQALQVLREMQRPDALVEDTAEAALIIYKLASQIPNATASEDFQDWEEISEEEMMQLPPFSFGESEDAEGSSSVQIPMGEEMDYESPQPVDFRGEFKPELVQLLMKMRDAKQSSGGQQQATPLTPEQLKELLEKSVEIQITEFAEGDLASSSDLFLSNIMKEMGTPPTQNQQQQDARRDSAYMNAPDSDKPLAPEPQYFYYDEWDFRAGDYKPRWCRVIEHHLSEGNAEFYDQTLRRYAGLAAQTRRQFELMKPEMFRKIKRLLEGEEFDLDALVEYVSEKAAGHRPNEKIYWRRNKVERDVAVAFLLDMSASTDEEISRRDRQRWQASDDDFDDDPRRYLAWWITHRAQRRANPVKRIIDLEKESTVLLIHALEVIGDAYGIYGFSGYGRENVSFYVIKDLNETFSERVKERIDRITPERSTRMGPAIRHATYKLSQHPAKVRILFLLSDGRPQDHGYGRDRTEKDYAIHDTHMALVEAKRLGIVPFALTVDREGHDYLKTMCHDIGYEVVADIESLPSRLPTLYRRLTE